MDHEPGDYLGEEELVLDWGLEVSGDHLGQELGHSDAFVYGQELILLFLYVVKSQNISILY